MKYTVGNFGQLDFNVNSTNIQLFICERPYIRIGNTISPIRIDCFNKSGGIIKNPKNYETPNKIRFVLPLNIILLWYRDTMEITPRKTNDSALLKEYIKFIKREIKC